MSSVSSEEFFLIGTNSLFVSALIFSEKWVIFQKTIFGKLSHFLVFGKDFENEFEIVICCLVFGMHKLFITFLV